MNDKQRTFNLLGTKKEENTIVVISNIIFEPYFNIGINKIFSNSNISITTVYIGIEEYNSYENTKKIVDADYIMICINFDYWFPDLTNKMLLNQSIGNHILNYTKSKYKELYDWIKQKTKAPILLYGFEDYSYKYKYIKCESMNNHLVDKINCEIMNIVGADDVYIDLKHMIAEIGIINSYNDKGKYRWNAPYSENLIVKICDSIYKYFLAQKGISKKCIVLDCDNVLWGGTLSEDGVESIMLGGLGLGRSYQDFQRYLLTLYYHGVILTICSKNDLNDVMYMFKEHNGMILKEEHIACFQVNWSDKPNNIRAISKELNIGLDSMIFIDDSDFEIEGVKALIPEVKTIKYKVNMNYEEFACFNLKSKIDIQKVIQRNMTYKTDNERKLLMSRCKEFDEYIKALEIKIDINKSTKTEYARISELSQRTNKCTNGRRYTVAQLSEEVNEKDYTIYSVYVSDKFSDLGLVGAIGISNNTLDLFCLSCRALGRNVEDKMIDVAISKEVCKYTFIETNKNYQLKLALKAKIKTK